MKVLICIIDLRDNNNKGCIVFPIHHHHCHHCHHCHHLNTYSTNTHHNHTNNFTFLDTLQIELKKSIKGLHIVCSSDDRNENSSILLIHMIMMILIDSSSSSSSSSSSYFLTGVFICSLSAAFNTFGSASAMIRLTDVFLSCIPAFSRLTGLY